MSEPPRSPVRLSVNLTEGQYIRLNEIALKSDVSLAWVVRQAVQQYLDATQYEQIPLPIRLDRPGTSNV
jgi:hypothetical protein